VSDQQTSLVISGLGGTDPSQPSLLAVLRAATCDVHERLHGHRGLAAVQAGTIRREDYVPLLRRLYGFHRPFEAVAGIAARRTGWLEADLAVFGIDREMCSAFPSCQAFPEQISPGYLLGAQYVVEGSALGGQSLARRLDGLLGAGVTAGRLFFTGHGGATGSVWRNYLAQLSASPDEPSSRANVIHGATETFTIFEQWLDGWDSANEQTNH
jgi:heme oxygenase (biliverdin-IX-beta and delta-forming)